MASPSAPAGSGVDWEARYQAGDTPWDKGRAHPALLEWLTQNSLTGRVLVPGCGAGHDARAIAGQPGTEVTGLDLAPSAIASAARLTPSKNVHYRLGDFLKDPPAGEYDWIFEHTCFCAIDPSLRSAYANAAAQALRPGGHLLAIFYRNPDHEDGPPFGCTMEEIDALFEGAFEAVATRENLPTFEGREHREVLRVFRRRA